MRDITLEDTFTFDFTTRAFATGVPTALAGTPALSVHEGGNDTFITAGVSLDVSVGTVAVVGLNEGTVVATAANGYEAGKTYSVFISTGTVAGVSVVGEVVEKFTIALSAAAVDLANATDGLGAIKAETALIVADTGTDGVVVSADGFADIFSTTAMTEAYAADAATATPAQMLYMIWSKLSEGNKSGTTLTCKKLDGSTNAMTFTLDDAKTPSTITRAT